MKTLKMMMLVALMAFAPVQASAGDYEVQNVMDDALYGAGVGALVGLGLMLLTDKPKDNWNYVSRGLGVGIIAGAAFGVYRSGKALAQVEDGKINFSMPMPELAFIETPTGKDLAISAPLIGGSF